MSAKPYVDRVAHNLRECEYPSVGICPGCDTCRKEAGKYTPREPEEDGNGLWTFEARPGLGFSNEEQATAGARVAFEEDWSAGKMNSETSFSWSSCGICDNPLGGDREVWHYVQEGKIYHESDACMDCVIYLANGDLPEEVPV